MSRRQPLIVAIDPGVSGGLVCGYAHEPPKLYRLTTAPGDLAAFLTDLKRTHKDIVMVVEEVGGFVGKPQPGSRMFTFGANYGVILGVAAGLGIQVVKVRPQKWQSSMGLRSDKGESKAEWKRRLKVEASKFYPNHKVTLYTADALLIWHAVARGFLIL